MSHSLRTQARGKGRVIAKVNAVDVSQAGNALSRLHKKQPFEFVLYVPYVNYDEVYMKGVIK